MPLISVSDLWKMFEFANGRKAADKAAVSKWLSAVYDDLEELANHWRALCGSMVDSKQDRQCILHILNIKPLPNVRSFSRLKAFYDSGSLVLGARHPEFRDTFLDALASVIQKRQNIQAILRTNRRAALAVENMSDRVVDLSSAHEALDDEVAKLQVLIRTFDATE
jgi:hypothetical protein